MTDSQAGGQTGGQAARDDVTCSIRMPNWLHAQLRRMADDQDRSFGSVVRQAAQAHADRGEEGRFQFPESELGGRSTYQAVVRWQMPAFDVTEEVIERMLHEVGAVMERYGVVGPVDMWPHEYRPMRTVRIRHYPPDEESQAIARQECYGGEGDGVVLSRSEESS